MDGSGTVWDQTEAIASAYVWRTLVGENPCFFRQETILKPGPPVVFNPDLLSFPQPPSTGRVWDKTEAISTTDVPAWRLDEG